MQYTCLGDVNFAACSSTYITLKIQHILSFIVNLFSFIKQLIFATQDFKQQHYYL